MTDKTTSKAPRPVEEVEMSKALPIEGMERMHPSVRAVMVMMHRRGFKDVTMTERKGHTLIYARTQTQEEHPRPNGEAVALIDFEVSFSRSKVESAMLLLFDEARKNKIPPGISSLIFIYSSKKTGSHSATLEDIYTHILLSSGSKTGYYLETISIQLFQIDWSLPRSTRNWRLYRKEHFVLMYTKEGKPILVDRPPTIMCESEEILYLGGRPSECASFERLECIEVGPMWVKTMREISKRVVPRLADFATDGK